MMTNERQRCSRCKVDLPVDNFKIKRCGNAMKQCIDCNKKRIQSTYCEHKKRRSTCAHCGGSEVCEHQRRRNNCRECKGASICEHNKRRGRCKECSGASLCEHGREQNTCKDCGGASICEHNRRRSQCKACCGGSICEHNNVRSRCKECGGGSICSHGRTRWTCKECKGGSICEHNRLRNTCKHCDLGGYLRVVVSTRIRDALASHKELSSLSYLGAGIDEIKEHIESRFEDGMTWSNHGEWHIDHIVPLKFNSPTLEEQVQRLHYTNLQPLWAKDNLAKNNKYVG